MKFLKNRKSEFTYTNIAFQVVNFQSVFLKIFNLEIVLAAADEEIALFATAIVIADKKRKGCQRYWKRCWLNPWVLRRLEGGQYFKLPFELNRKTKKLREFSSSRLSSISKIDRSLSTSPAKSRYVYAKIFGTTSVSCYHFTSSGNRKLLHVKVARSIIDSIVPEVWKSIIAECLDEVMRCPTFQNDERK